MKPIASLIALFVFTGNLHAQSAVAVENNALVPVGKLENDFYDWNKRHAEILSIKDGINPEIVMIGDSITHFWAGPPNEPKGNKGSESWKDLFGEKRVLNLGFGWDRTQNVLYRIQQGELDGLTPKTIVIHIGTNNLATSKNAPTNTPEQIPEAIQAIVEKAHEKCPKASIILMAVFPRGQNSTDPKRAQISEINKRISKISKPYLSHVDLTDKFLSPDGTISREVMGDYLHPSAKGYQIWADALKPLVK